MFSFWNDGNPLAWIEPYNNIDTREFIKNTPSSTEDILKPLRLSKAFDITSKRKRRKKKSCNEYARAINESRFERKLIVYTASKAAVEMAVRNELEVI